MLHNFDTVNFKYQIVCLAAISVYIELVFLFREWVQNDIAIFYKRNSFWLYECCISCQHFIYGIETQSSPEINHLLPSYTWFAVLSLRAI